jgi:FemAB-related protein (PEP-CTERM system-associated)
MQIKLLDTEEEQYRCFIDTNSESSLYHTLEWRDVIQNTYGYKPYYLIARDAGSIKGAMPLFQVNSLINGKHMVSLPFSHCVKILYQDSFALKELIECAKDLTLQKNCNYLEVRHGIDITEIPGLKCSRHFLDSLLDIRISLDDVWANFQGSVRKAIRKAEQNPIKIIRGTDLEHYRQFFMLELETRRRQGSPPYALRFFENLYSKFHTSGKARLYLAYFENQAIGGALILYHHKTAIYGYGGSTSNKDLLRFRPNNLLFWLAIQDAHNEGFNLFDFGITPPSNKGLLRFKSGWGTHTSALPYYFFLSETSKIPGIDRESPASRFAASIFKRMPIDLLRFVGPFFLKHLG